MWKRLIRRKYNEPFAGKKLLKSLQTDRRIFLKKQGIAEERV